MNKSKARLARVAAPAAVVAGIASVAVIGLPTGANAASCTTSGTTTTCVYTFTGTEQTFLVPTGVTSLTITAIGAAGETIGTNPGGAGAQVFSTIGAIPGTTLFVEVGGAGGVSTFNGGGLGAATAGDGGGASDVRTIARADAGTLPSRLVVAGGGGGAGSDGTCGAGTGGDGGAQAAAGANGAICVVASSGGTGGGAGTSSAGGALGDGGAGGTAGSPGTVGTPGTGGDGGISAGAACGGGGGGGGVFGGGGGGGGLTGADVGAGGGGGGGSSHGTSLGSTSAAASVTIAYTTPSTTLAITTSSPLPNANIGHFYSTTLAATGGTGSYTWSRAGGGLPRGLSLSSGGTISGTVNAYGSYSYRARVTDSAGSTATKTFQLTVMPRADLAVTLFHNGTCHAGQSRRTFSVVVTNTGTAATSTAATNRVWFNVPNGLVVTQGGSGTGWQCSKRRTPLTARAPRASPPEPPRPSR
jgi:hypothetical protein